MSGDQIPDDFEATLKYAILGAFGFSSEAELEAEIAKAMGPTYLEATAEYRAREAAYRATLPERVEEARQAVTEHLRSVGMLPDGVEFEITPMDLQSDPKWMAEAPWLAEPRTRDYPVGG